MNTKNCPKCGFRFTIYKGVGMMFPSVYMDTVEKAKKGELGQEIQDFFKQFPNGAINAEGATLCCNTCGNIARGKNLTMYIPKEGYSPCRPRGAWSVCAPQEDYFYVLKSDLDRNYTEYAKYPHKCAKCGGDMHIADDKEEDTLKCPHCKVQMEDDGLIMWD